VRHFRICQREREQPARHLAVPALLLGAIQPPLGEIDPVDYLLSFHVERHLSIASRFSAFLVSSRAFRLVRLFNHQPPEPFNRLLVQPVEV